MLKLSGFVLFAAVFQTGKASEPLSSTADENPYLGNMLSIVNNDMNGIDLGTDSLSAEVTTLLSGIISSIYEYWTMRPHSLIPEWDNSNALDLDIPLYSGIELERLIDEAKPTILLCRYINLFEQRSVDQNLPCLDSTFNTLLRKIFTHAWLGLSHNRELLPIFGISREYSVRPTDSVGILRWGFVQDMNVVSLNNQSTQEKFDLLVFLRHMMTIWGSLANAPILNEELVLVQPSYTDAASTWPQWTKMRHLLEECHNVESLENTVSDYTQFIKSLITYADNRSYLNWITRENRIKLSAAIEDVLSILCLTMVKQEIAEPVSLFVMNAMFEHAFYPVRGTRTIIGRISFLQTLVEKFDREQGNKLTLLYSALHDQVQALCQYIACHSTNSARYEEIARETRELYSSYDERTIALDVIVPKIRDVSAQISNKCGSLNSGDLDSISYNSELAATRISPDQLPTMFVSLNELNELMDRIAEISHLLLMKSHMCMELDFSNWSRMNEGQQFMRRVRLDVSKIELNPAYFAGRVESELAYMSDFDSMADLLAHIWRLFYALDQLSFSLKSQPTTPAHDEDNLDITVEPFNESELLSEDKLYDNALSNLFLYHSSPVLIPSQGTIHQSVEYLKNWLNCLVNRVRFVNQLAEDAVSRTAIESLEQFFVRLMKKMHYKVLLEERANGDDSTDKLQYTAQHDTAVARYLMEDHAADETPNRPHRYIFANRLRNLRRMEHETVESTELSLLSPLKDKPKLSSEFVANYVAADIQDFLNNLELLFTTVVQDSTQAVGSGSIVSVDPMLISIVEESFILVQDELFIQGICSYTVKPMDFVLEYFLNNRESIIQSIGRLNHPLVAAQMRKLLDSIITLSECSDADISKNDAILLIRESLVRVRWVLLFESSKWQRSSVHADVFTVTLTGELSKLAISPDDQRIIRGIVDRIAQRWFMFRAAYNGGRYVNSASTDQLRFVLTSHVSHMLLSDTRAMLEVAGIKREVDIQNPIYEALNAIFETMETMNGKGSKFPVYGHSSYMMVTAEPVGLFPGLAEYFDPQTASDLSRKVHEQILAIDEQIRLLVSLTMENDDFGQNDSYFIGFADSIMAIIESIKNMNTVTQTQRRDGSVIIIANLIRELVDTDLSEKLDSPTENYSQGMVEAWYGSSNPASPATTREVIRELLNLLAKKNYDDKLRFKSELIAEFAKESFDRTRFVNEFNALFEKLTGCENTCECMYKKACDSETVSSATKLLALLELMDPNDYFYYTKCDDNTMYCHKDDYEYYAAKCVGCSDSNKYSAECDDYPDSDQYAARCVADSKDCRMAATVDSSYKGQEYMRQLSDILNNQMGDFDFEKSTPSDLTVSERKIISDIKLAVEMFWLYQELNWGRTPESQRASSYSGEEFSSAVSSVKPFAEICGDDEQSGINWRAQCASQEFKEILLTVLSHAWLALSDNGRLVPMAEDGTALSNWQLLTEFDVNPKNLRYSYYELFSLLMTNWNSLRNSRRAESAPDLFDPAKYMTESDVPNLSIASQLYAVTVDDADQVQQVLTRLRDSILPYIDVPFESENVWRTRKDRDNYKSILEEYISFVYLLAVDGDVNQVLAYKPGGYLASLIGMAKYTESRIARIMALVRSANMRFVLYRIQDELYSLCSYVRCTDDVSVNYVTLSDNTAFVAEVKRLYNYISKTLRQTFGSETHPSRYTPASDVPATIFLSDLEALELQTAISQLKGILSAQIDRIHMDDSAQQLTTCINELVESDNSPYLENLVDPALVGGIEKTTAEAIRDILDILAPYSYSDIQKFINELRDAPPVDRSTLVDSLEMYANDLIQIDQEMRYKPAAESNAMLAASKLCAIVDVIKIKGDYDRLTGKLVDSADVDSPKVCNDVDYDGSNQECKAVIDDYVKNDYACTEEDYAQYTDDVGKTTYAPSGVDDQSIAQPIDDGYTLNYLRNVLEKVDIVLNGGFDFAKSPIQLTREEKNSMEAILFDMQQIWLYQVYPWGELASIDASVAEYSGDAILVAMREMQELIRSYIEINQKQVYLPDNFRILFHRTISLIWLGLSNNGLFVPRVPLPTQLQHIGRSVNALQLFDNKHPHGSLPALNNLLSDLMSEWNLLGNAAATTIGRELHITELYFTEMPNYAISLEAYTSILSNPMSIRSVVDAHRNKVRFSFGESVANAWITREERDAYKNLLEKYISLIYLILVDGDLEMELVYNLGQLSSTDCDTFVSQSRYMLSQIGSQISNVSWSTSNYISSLCMYVRCPPMSYNDTTSDNTEVTVESLMQAYDNINNILSPTFGTESVSSTLFVSKIEFASLQSSIAELTTLVKKKLRNEENATVHGVADYKE